MRPFTFSSVESRAVRNTTGTWCAVGAQALHDLEAVAVGEHHVEHDEVGPERLGRAERVGAGAGDLDVEAFVAQGGRDEVGDVRLVVDDEDAPVAAVEVPVHVSMLALAAVRLL